MNSASDISDWDRISSEYSRRIEASGDRCMPQIRDMFWHAGLLFFLNLRMNRNRKKIDPAFLSKFPVFLMIDATKG